MHSSPKAQGRLPLKWPWTPLLRKRKQMKYTHSLSARRISYTLYTWKGTWKGNPPDYLRNWNCLAPSVPSEGACGGPCWSRRFSWWGPGYPFLLRHALWDIMPLEVQSTPTLLTFHKGLKGSANWPEALIESFYTGGGWWSEIGLDLCPWVFCSAPCHLCSPI